jgi:hypothetical protein
VRAGAARAAPAAVTAACRPAHPGSRRELVYEVLEEDETGHPAGRVVRKVIVALILVSVTASILETFPSLQARFGPLFLRVEDVCVLIFTIDYGLRLWCSVEDRAGRPRDRGRGGCATR